MHKRHSFVGMLESLRDLGWTPNAIIDIGVGQGTPGLYTTWPGVPICLVEPAPTSAAFVDQIVETFPSVQAYKVGASNRAGVMTVRRDESGVFVTFGGHKAKWEAIEVPVMTCDQIVADAGLTGPFLYKLDTDAHELEIIEGSAETLKSADVCVVELNFLHPHVGLAGPSDITGVLHNAGFGLFDVSRLRYSLQGVARTADAVFVKLESDLFQRLARANNAKGAKDFKPTLKI
jgi:FkbM family methyltransferase